MNFKKISALACTMTILGGMATATPVFAAPLEANANNQTSKVPVVGQIGRWKDGNTDINNPSSPDSGSQGGNGEVEKPNNVTDINVTVPTSMTFDVVTNTTDSNPAFASADYTVTNNGSATVSMSGQYNVTADGGVTLVDQSELKAKGDGNVQLALSLKSGEKGSESNPFISSVTNTAKSTTPIDIGSNQNTNLKFDATVEGMADVKEEALAGTFAEQTKITKGDLVLTFQTKAE